MLLEHPGLSLSPGSAADNQRCSETLYEDESFPERELAALVAAKIYYQLQEYNESMVFALGAGKLFDIHHSGEFEETILGEFSYYPQYDDGTV